MSVSETIKQLMSDSAYDEAMNMLNGLLKEQPANDEAYYLRGLLFNHLGKWGEAMGDLNMAISLNPNSPAVTLRQMLHEIVEFRYNDLLNP